jgi:putative hemolysin
MELLIIILFLLLTAFFSGSETAFLSFDNFMVEIWRKQKKTGHKTVQKFVQRPERYLSLTLVGTNISNIAYSSIATLYLLDRGFPNVAVFVILPLVMLLAGEIIPKAIFLQLANRLVITISPLLAFFEIVLFVPMRITQWIALWISKTIGIKIRQEVAFFTVPDLKSLIHEAEAIGLVDKAKRDLIQRILMLQERRVRDIMTPRTEIVAVDVNSEMFEIKKAITESGYSRLVVYEKDLDNVMGTIRAKDFLYATDDITKRIHHAKVVPESISLFTLLREMRKDHKDFALVVDEYGGTAGIITLEDVLEELVGNIEDEYDREEKPFRQIVPGTILASGRAEVDHINLELGEQIPTGDYATVAGWILDRLGRIPRTGDMELIDGYTVKILRASKNRIHSVLIRNENDSVVVEREKRT